LVYSRLIHTLPLTSGDMQNARAMSRQKGWFSLGEKRGRLNFVSAECPGLEN
jgi:hypothetical protein